MDERPTDSNMSAPPPPPSGKGTSVLAVALIIVCLMLSVGLYVSHTKSQKQDTERVATITTISNQLVTAKEQLEEQKQVNTSLESNLGARSEEIKKLSNVVTQTSQNLARTEAEAKKAQEQFQKEMKARDDRIAELEGQRDDLTKRMTDLNASITEKEALIAETQKKLETSEGDRTFLIKELKRLQQEKMDLERQFNDLAMLRDQVRKLKDELSISRRLEWIRRGFYGTPAAAKKLEQPLSSTNKNFNLDVELKQGDKSIKVNPTATNAPAPPK